MGYWFNEEEIQKKLDELRNYLKENREILDWKKEGEILENIEVLKKDLAYARLLSQVEKSKNYSSHVLEMKIKFGK
ncbi:MAG: hypothetical protein QXP77_03970 [Candidatus Aenigmatarchaeota archaeon]